MQNELDGDFSKMHVKIRFRIKEVLGTDALTEFVGHDFMKDFVRRQIRRDRGKIDDTVDVVTEDGFFIRIKPFIVTRSRVKASQKQETRSVARDEIIKFCAKSTWIDVQKALMSGSLEEIVTKAVAKIQPVRGVFFRRSQLIQDGVTIDSGPTLEEVKSEEKAAKEASENTTHEDVEESVVEGDIENLDEEASESKEGIDEPEKETDPVEGNSDNEVDYESMTVAQLKELLKAASKPVSGKKADLISRLLE